jgi:hypothetical protein
LCLLSRKLSCESDIAQITLPSQIQLAVVKFSISKARFCISMFRIPAQARSSLLDNFDQPSFSKTCSQFRIYLILLAGQIQSVTVSFLSRKPDFVSQCLGYPHGPDQVCWQFLTTASFLENLFAISDYLVSLAGQIQLATTSFLSRKPDFVSQCLGYPHRPDQVNWQCFVLLSFSKTYSRFRIYLISLAGQIQSAASSISMTPHTKLTEQYSFSKAYSWTRYCASYTCKPDPVYWQFSVEAIELGGGLVDFLVASCCFEELL